MQKEENKYTYNFYTKAENLILIKLSAFSTIFRQNMQKMMIK